MDPLSARYSLLAFEIGDLNGAWFVKKGNRRKKEVLAVHRNPIAYRKVPARKNEKGKKLCEAIQDPRPGQEHPRDTYGL